MAVRDEPEFLHFQDLVDQARLSIVTYCPEWTDYNLSDPGITLIELFATMTTQLNYRLNRVPERNHLKFLEMIGQTPKPLAPAKTNLFFCLSTPLPLVRADDSIDNSVQTKIPVNTEVATRRTSGMDPEIIFSTLQEHHLQAPKLIEVRRDFDGRDTGGHFSKNWQPGFDKSEPFEPFQDKPQVGDIFYLGFDPNIDIRGYHLHLDIDCTGGLGGDVENPPLIWEWVEDKDTWRDISQSQFEDKTSGLTQTGYLRLHLPARQTLQSGLREIRGVRAYWLRCRLAEADRNQGEYTESPIIKRIRPFVLGITVPAIQAALVEKEVLGQSDGTSGQVFQLSRSEILPLDPERDEFVEVEEEQKGGLKTFVRWTPITDFAHSDRYDRHFILDVNRGTVTFGPIVRLPNGKVKQFGKIPKLGSRIRITKYRAGGGARGNVPVGSLQVLKRPISYVMDVTNPEEATGGRDPESIELTKIRARQALRGRQRAVSTDDYQTLCRERQDVVGVKCLERRHDNLAIEPGTVKILVVPTPPQINQPDVDEETRDATRRLELLYQLRVKESQIKSLEEFLEPYRILGISLLFDTPTYLGVKIAANIQCTSDADTSKVKAAILRSLENFLNPVRLIKNERNGTLEDEAEISQLFKQAVNEESTAEKQVTTELGWEFGQALYISDIYAEIKAVPEVRHVTEAKLWWCELSLNDEIPEPDDLDWTAADDDVIALAEDSLLYFLDGEDIHLSIG